MKKSLITQGFKIENYVRLGVLSPVEIRGVNGRDFYLISESFSKKYERLDRVLEKVPIINRLAIISIYKARK